MKGGHFTYVRFFLSLLLFLISSYSFSLAIQMRIRPNSRISTSAELFEGGGGGASLTLFHQCLFPEIQILTQKSQTKTHFKRFPTKKLAVNLDRSFVHEMKTVGVDYILINRLKVEILAVERGGSVDWLLMVGEFCC